jgi:hypothetical protein
VPRASHQQVVLPCIDRHSPAYNLIVGVGERIFEDEPSLVFGFQTDGSEQGNHLSALFDTCFILVPDRRYEQIIFAVLIPISSGHVMPEIPEPLLLVIADRDCSESKLSRILCLLEEIDLSNRLPGIAIARSPGGAND